MISLYFLTVSEFCSRSGLGISQWKDLMLVFSSPPEAISFDLRLQEYLNNNFVADVSLAGLLQIGVHEGSFSSMGPHNITSRADYYGTAVNRAARVAGAKSPGQVFLGMIAQGDDGVLLLNDGWKASFAGIRHLLKGMQTPV
jgi:hypothetical protein